MDDKRASTFEALEKFIQTQRMLLEQTQEDITKLKRLRLSVLSKSTVDPQDLFNQIHEVGEIHDVNHYQLVIPKEIDWNVFNGCDPAPFHALAQSVQEKYAKRAQPPTTQTLPLSDLQVLVKESKRTIIDPALGRYATYMAEFPLGDDDELEASLEHSADQQYEEDWRIEMEREREKEKIRELKKRKIHAGLSLPGMRGGGSGGGGAAVFVRRDVEDESAEVDVLAPDDADGGSKRTPVLLVKDDGEAADSGLDVPSTLTGAAPMKRPRPTRERRATAKKKQWNEKTSSPKRQKALSPSTSIYTPTPTPALVLSLAGDGGSPMDVDDAEDRPFNANDNANGITINGKSQGNSNKPRPETYKQAWTDSEQNLLEQLLEKIPDGEKNRWQKISRAMNGRRTPRQVASRVQKYFEKLKKFGIDISKAHGKASKAG